MSRLSLNLCLLAVLGGAVLLALLNLGTPETSAVHHLIACDLVGARPWRGEAVRCIGGVSRPAAFAAHSAKVERHWLTEDLSDRERAALHCAAAKLLARVNDGVSCARPIGARVDEKRARFVTGGL